MPRLLVLYGSQTGTAQDVAEQIWRESKRWSFSGPVLAIDDWPVQQLAAERLVIFVVATTGNGDEPDNMKQSWKFLLRRNLPPDMLEHLQFACLGLGDSSYTKFNYAAKRLNKRLQQLGAKPIQSLGLCDDQHDHGLAAVSLPWINSLFQELQQSLNLQAADVNREVFKWNTQVLSVTKLEDMATSQQLAWPLKETAFKSTLRHNVRTTAADHFQDVRLLRFTFPAEVTWRPGDALRVYPSNSDADVAKFFALAIEHNLPFTADTIVHVRSVDPDMPLPLVYAQPITIGELAKYVWDLSCRPRQRIFELLGLQCDDELEREKLLEFSSADGLDDLIAYVNRPRRTLLEVLEDFRHASSKLTLPLLVELFPLIQARSYSIASIPASGTLDLLVAVVDYRTKLSTPRLGLCSNWLKSLSTDTVVLGAIQQGTMSLPQNPHTPIIMVGPGTGIAPFRSVIQSRLAVNGGSLVVFFGCRNKDKDFHFASDFSEWQTANSDRVSVFVAFSRDQEKKVYVQHLIELHAERLRTLILLERAVVLVAGASNSMPKAVREAFTAVLDNNIAYMEQMVQTKRYQEETWS